MARWISPEPSGGSAENSRDRRAVSAQRVGLREMGRQQMDAREQRPLSVRPRLPGRIAA